MSANYKIYKVENNDYIISMSDNVYTIKSKHTGRFVKFHRYDDDDNQGDVVEFSDIREACYFAGDPCGDDVIEQQIERGRILYDEIFEDISYVGSVKPGERAEYGPAIIERDDKERYLRCADEFRYELDDNYHVVIEPGNDLNIDLGMIDADGNVHFLICDELITRPILGPTDPKELPPIKIYTNSGGHYIEIDGDTYCIRYVGEDNNLELVDVDGSVLTVINNIMYVKKNGVIEKACFDAYFQYRKNYKVTFVPGSNIVCFFSNILKGPHIFNNTMMYSRN